MTISPAPVPNQFRDNDGNILKLSVIEIGAWDMTSTITVEVNMVSVNAEDVHSILVQIDNDMGTGSYFNGKIPTSGGWVNLNYYTLSVTPTSIVLELDALTDSILFDSAVSNRGYLHVWHAI